MTARKLLLLGMIVVLLVGGAYRVWQLVWVGRFDTVVRGGTVFDGVNPPYKADLGIRDGRIARIGHLWLACAGRVIRARGLVVAPGFIDVHAHVERNFPKGCKPFQAPNFVLQGVTTLVTGNCGTSEVDVCRIFDRLEQCGSQVNVATLVGHNSVREKVMGRVPRTPTPNELRAMGDLVAQGMKEGALGLSTGLGYAPGRFADKAEVLSLARVAAEHGGIYVTHIRDEGANGQAALAEAIAVAREAELPLHVSHFKVSSRREWGSAAQRLALLGAAAQEGLRVTIDHYPYSASSSTLELLLPDEAVEDRSQLKRRLRDPHEREAIITAMLERLKANGWTDLSFARVAYCQSQPDATGHSISDLARRHPPCIGRLTSNPHRGSETSDRLRAEASVALDLYRRCNPQMVYEDMAEDDVATIMRFSQTSFGSDSGVRDNAQGRPHPRGWGTFPRVLAHYVRENPTLSLQEAIRRMTALPATTFGLTDRGRIRVGGWADLVVFDPHEIRDTATYDQPLNQPEGIRYVIVNGKVVAEDGHTTAAHPGRPIRRESAASASCR